MKIDIVELHAASGILGTNVVGTNTLSAIKFPSLKLSSCEEGILAETKEGRMALFPWAAVKVVILGKPDAKSK